MPALVGVGVPAVVAVVVTRDPGPWLEATLDVDRDPGVRQPHDAGGRRRIAGRPDRPGRRRSCRPRSSSAWTARRSPPRRTQALGTIEGASFFLFCHDDVELGPGAVQAMVEEAFRSNAGIVGAKLVDWDDPERLRSVGGSIDKFGFVWPNRRGRRARPGPARRRAGRHVRRLDGRDAGPLRPVRRPRRVLDRHRRLRRGPRPLLAGPGRRRADGGDARRTGPPSRAVRRSVRTPRATTGRNGWPTAIDRGSCSRTTARCTSCEWVRRRWCSPSPR